MDFFSVSKIFWGIFAPSHLLLWMGMAAALLLMRGRRRLGGWLAVASTGLLAGIGVLPAHILLLRPLENAYSRPTPPRHVDGILTLGGVSAEERLRVTYSLAKRFPNAGVVYSGGSGDLIDNQPDRDAQFAKQFLLGLGLNPSRLTLEGKSRNTWENILYTRSIVRRKPNETWLLAISAFQIPRTLEIACRLNWTLLPWPTDYISKQHGASGISHIPGNLWAFDLAVHEWIGIYAYRWSGKATPLSNCGR